MKQILLLCFFFLVNINLLKSQDIVITPNGVTLDTLIDFSIPFIQFETVGINTDIKNNSNEDVELRWKITQISGPPDWLPQLSVNGESGGSFSYGILSNTGAGLPNPIPLKIMANDQSVFNLRMRYLGIAGCGTYEIEVAPMSDTTNILVTGIYNFRINVDVDCNELVATENFDKSTAKIFPNPTSGYFSITENPDVKSIEIFNIVGKQMGIAPFQNGDAINVSNFPNGLYLVRMLDDDGDVLKTTRLTKR